MNRTAEALCEYSVSRHQPFINKARKTSKESSTRPLVKFADIHPPFRLSLYSVDRFLAEKIRGPHLV